MQLKPCPFCGGKAELTMKGNVHSTRKCIVKCTACRYQRTDAALRYGDDWLRATAIAAWNRRATAARDAEIEALLAEVNRLKSMTAVTMGVGSGGGKLFVHGDYESIKAAQEIVLEREALRAEREVIVAEAVKYAGKSGRLEAKVDRLADELRKITELRERHHDNLHDAVTIAEEALRDHEQEVGDGRN